MTQQLASANSDGRALDFGVIDFDLGHMRVTRGRYVCDWPMFTATDVTITTVADDYALPGPAASLWTPALAVSKQALSRPRFDAVFAKATGEAYYQNILAALATIAATSPMTDSTAAVKRALAALENPTDGIAYPTSDWTSSSTVHADDITGEFFALVCAAVVGQFPDIQSKILAGCALWPASI